MPSHFPKRSITKYHPGNAYSSTRCEGVKNATERSFALQQNRRDNLQHLREARGSVGHEMEEKGGGRTGWSKRFAVEPARDPGMPGARPDLRSRD
ncbi:hypothetical protein CEXT_483201 [Caerostris extrusa]|uniref:Uncharacterized protein n=1 Tax=Caerostris extrusa TaxID=172846 RepID=A0AAV4Y364_CAEEX|nr:hypothetical protein CEXT_483201 [Caerostris extrusa]